MKSVQSHFFEFILHHGDTADVMVISVDEHEHRIEVGSLLRRGLRRVCC